jgi:prolyl-tRNA synthetase
MRLSKYHLPTLKEAPKDAELASHACLIRGGYIRQLAAGIYDFLPLGVKVLHKVQRIIREELNRAGCLEVFLPSIQPSELWRESGRWDYYGPELLRMKDRHGREFCYGPTHEEVITDLVRRDVRSYRDLPVNLYQIQTKFRDEVKPRAGLMRGREFIMKDAYSFDVNEAGARESYRAMYDAYCRIFQRCGLEFRAVEADTGNIGGTMSHEFQVVAETGEDYVLRCDHCDFTVNQELAPLSATQLPAHSGEGVPALERVHTPTQRTVEEVSNFLDVPPERIVKTLICQVDDHVVAVCLCGHHELEEVKLRKALGATQVSLATDEIVEQVTGARVGFAGPVGLKKRIPVVADFEVSGLHDVVVGANEDDHHFRHAQPGRDFVIEKFLDVRAAQDGDSCPMCSRGHYRLFRGIEVGHVFYLGTKYSKAMDCTYLDEDGKSQYAVMGCYGIGVTRIMSAAIEQHHDDKGIRWPVPLAPFEIAVLPMNTKDEALVVEAERLYQGFRKEGIDVILDDRPGRPGVKFADADLVGYPYQVIVGGRGLESGTCEVKVRRSDERLELPADRTIEILVERVRKERGESVC